MELRLIRFLCVVPEVKKKNLGNYHELDLFHLNDDSSFSPYFQFYYYNYVMLTLSIQFGIPQRNCGLTYGY